MLFSLSFLGLPGHDPGPLIMSWPMGTFFLLKNVNIDTALMLAQTAFESFLLADIVVLIHKAKLTARKSSDDILVRVLAQLFFI